MQIYMSNIWFIFSAIETNRGQVWTMKTSEKYMKYWNKMKLISPGRYLEVTA